MNRRELLGGVSAALVTTGLVKNSFAATTSGATSLSAEAADSISAIASGAGAEPGKSSDARIRLGVIGPGSRGQELIRQFLHVPNVEITAVCDIYEPRFAEVNKLVGRTVPNTKDYHELLERKDLDALVVATPLAMHEEHLLAALHTGRPVYGEKALAFKPDQCQALYNEVIRGKRTYQIGHEYRYASWVQEAIRKVRAGAIGEPTHVYAYWHRNNSWRRPVPSPDLEHLINWRLYKESSGGLVTELGSHQIDIANWVFGSQPTQVWGDQSIVKYHDGRTVGDNSQAVFNYANGRRLVFSALTDNAREGNQLWIYGTEGSIQITIEDATLYYEPKASHHTAANAQIVQNGITTGASYGTANEMPYRGPGERIQVPESEDPTLAACRSFIHCVRNGEKPVADIHVGFASSISSSVANLSVNAEEKMQVPQPA